MPRGGKSNGGPRTHAVKNPGYTGAIDAMYDPVAYINCQDGGYGVVSGPSLTPLDKLGTFKGKVYYISREQFNKH